MPCEKKMNPIFASRSARKAFSLVELLIVIAIIGVLTSMVVSSFSNATQDARGVVVLQQQAVLQEALNSWVARASSPDGLGSLTAARGAYSNAGTAAAKMALIDGYLDDSTTGQFTAHGSVANALNSPAMEKIGQYVTFSAWASGSYPKVELHP